MESQSYRLFEPLFCSCTALWTLPLSPRTGLVARIWWPDGLSCTPIPTPWGMPGSTRSDHPILHRNWLRYNCMLLPLRIYNKAVEGSKKWSKLSIRERERERARENLELVENMQLVVRVYIYGGNWPFFQLGLKILPQNITLTLRQAILHFVFFIRKGV